MVYVVYGRQGGSGSGRPEWGVGAYFSKVMAFEHAKLAQARAKELHAWTSPNPAGGRFNWAATPESERPANQYDPNMEMTHMGVVYFVYEVPFLEAIPGVPVPEVSEPAPRPTFWERLERLDLLDEEVQEHPVLHVVGVEIDLSTNDPVVRLPDAEDVLHVEASEG